MVTSLQPSGSPTPGGPSRKDQSPPSFEYERLVSAVTDWFAVAARPLPWRHLGTSAWAILVSEFMAQQTPVSRVVEPWRAWLERWPTPAALAADSAGEAVRAWGRLGYPRRALRLHAASVAITERHGGRVPQALEELRALPGIGEYTAAAVVAFAFGGRSVVLDTNVRRVLARAVLGRRYPSPGVTAAERQLADEVAPQEDGPAARWAAASMELGALICTARNPQCGNCPVAEQCRWLAAGKPAGDQTPRKAQGYAGTDRQCRGALLEVLRRADGFVAEVDLAPAWSDSAQRERALRSLIDDGLLVAVPGTDHLSLPS